MSRQTERIRRLAAAGDDPTDYGVPIKKRQHTRQALKATGYYIDAEFWDGEAKSTRASERLNDRAH